MIPTPTLVEFNLARPGRRNSHNLSIGVRALIRSAILIGCSTLNGTDSAVLLTSNMAVAG